MFTERLLCRCYDILNWPTGQRATRPDHDHRLAALHLLVRPLVRDVSGADPVQLLHTSARGDRLLRPVERTTDAPAKRLQRGVRRQQDARSTTTKRGTERKFWTHFLSCSLIWNGQCTTDKDKAFRPSVERAVIDTDQDILTKVIIEIVFVLSKKLYKCPFFRLPSNPYYREMRIWIQGVINVLLRLRSLRNFDTEFQIFKYSSFPRIIYQGKWFIYGYSTPIWLWPAIVFPIFWALSTVNRMIIHGNSLDKTDYFATSSCGTIVGIEMPNF